MYSGNESLHLPAELLSFVKAIAGETRVNVLLLFTDGRKRTVNDIAAGIGLSQSATSEQLSAMRSAGLLSSTREGKEVYYWPNRGRIVDSLDRLSGILKQCCKL